MALTSTLVPPTLFSVCNSAFFIHRMLVSQKSSHHACVKTLRYTRLTTAHNVHCLKRSRLKHVGIHCSLDRDYFAYAFKDAKNRALVYIHVGCAVSEKIRNGNDDNFDFTSKRKMSVTETLTDVLPFDLSLNWPIALQVVYYDVSRWIVGEKTRGKKTTWRATFWGLAKDRMGTEGGLTLNTWDLILWTNQWSVKEEVCYWFKKKNIFLKQYFYINRNYWEILEKLSKKDIKS